MLMSNISLRCKKHTIVRNITIVKTYNDNDLQGLSMNKGKLIQVKG